MIVESVLEKAAPAGRKASRDVRRHQLIEATVEVLARKGYSALTIADVAKAAGLSAGIINFHFESKDKLLAASLLFLAEEYRRNWQKALASAPLDPAGKLKALLFADFDDAVYTPSKLAAWIAFWGETQGRPVYDAICGEFDRERLRATREFCGALIREGGYGHEIAAVASVLDALGDGLWHSAASAKGTPGTAADAARIAFFTVLSAFFPKHFKVPS